MKRLIYTSSILLVFGITFMSAKQCPAVEKTNARQVASVAPEKSSGGPLNLEMHSSQHELKDLLNPFDKLWSEPKSVTVPLYRQDLVVPFGGGSINSISVKSLKLKEGVIFRLEWTDASKDNDTVHQSKFRDAAAIEFPIGQVEDTVLSMGSPHGPVNIWHWKADWEADAPVMNTGPYANGNENPDGRAPLLYPKLAVDSAREQEVAQGKNGPTGQLRNFFPQNLHKRSPVEDIVAIGISSVTSKPEHLQSLQGRGQWKDGSWHLVIFKPDAGKDDQTSPQFKTGRRLNLAFAVWNGSAQDRNGMKSISNWSTLICR